ncbi:MAG: hypothetical protein OEY78_00535 [Gammaproteobacteria bacterium]|nr:hypothetical protein [Gammaproteobacteria bacterium]
MKNIIKTTIGIIAISLAGISVSQADTDRQRDNDRADRYSQKQQAKQFNRFDKHYRMHRQQRGNHLYDHVKRPHWKHSNWKRHYLKHERRHAMKQVRRDRAYRRAVKQMYRDRAYRRALKRELHREYRHNYRPARYVAPSYNVTYSSHSHGNKFVPVVAGSIIGSSIANHASHGDPGATVGGAIFGAIIGNAVANH